jgi:hypothetical protein
MPQASEHPWTRSCAVDAEEAGASREERKPPQGGRCAKWQSRTYRCVS